VPDESKGEAGESGIRLFIPWAWNTVRSFLQNIFSLIPPLAFGRLPIVVSRDSRTFKFRENQANREFIVHLS
jgi:hypothetical protein